MKQLNKIIITSVLGVASLTAQAQDWTPGTSSLLDLNTTYKGIRLTDNTASSNWLKFSVLAGDRIDFNAGSALSFYRFNKSLELKGDIKAYTGGLGLYTGTGSTPRIYMGTTKAVGINTATPNANATLDVNGHLYLSNSAPSINVENGGLDINVLEGNIDIKSEEGVDIQIDADGNSNNNQTSFRVGLADPITGATLFKVRENKTASFFNTDTYNNTALYLPTSYEIGLHVVSTYATALGYGVKSTVSKDDTKAFAATSSVTGEDVFRVYGNGKVECKEIKVTLTGWADYVFANDYKLMSLSNLEKYIATNKHLPGIQSAKEIEAEGLSVGEMQKQQMEKIEELTLYIIELQKQIDALKVK